MNEYVKRAIQTEIDRLEDVKKEFPNKDEEWLYEPDLSRLKEELKNA